MGTLLLTGAGTATDSTATGIAGVAGKVLWVKPESLGANGTSISSWADSSGLSHDLSQATSSKQPTVVTNTLNGYSVARFDGVDDFMSASAFTLSQPTTVISVWKARTAAPGGSRVTIFDGNTTNSMRLLRGLGSVVQMYAGSFGPSFAVDGNDAFHVWTTVFNAASSEMREDGGTAATGNSGTGNAGGFIVAATAPSSSPAEWDAIDVAEIIVFNKVLTSGDRVTVESALKTKYGL